MLGIAGAYLLRAAVQSGSLPRWPVIAVSIAYAFVWLIPATRVPAKAWFASAAWAGTSALILMPMLWELTLRFRFLPSAATAGILVAFVLAASALAWKRHFAVVAGIADATASLAALVLAVASRDLTPFLFALLAMAIVGEVAAARHRSLRVRPVVAAAADIAVFALIWIYSGPADIPADYPPSLRRFCWSSHPLLLCIYGASAAAQTLLLRRRHFVLRDGTDAGRRFADGLDGPCFLARAWPGPSRRAVSDRLGRRLRRGFRLVRAAPRAAQLPRLRDR